MVNSLQPLASVLRSMHGTSTIVAVAALVVAMSGSTEAVSLANTRRSLIRGSDHASSAVLAEMTAAGASASPPSMHCGCGMLAMESQLMRATALAFPTADQRVDSGPMGDCYAFQHMAYSLPDGTGLTAIVKHSLGMPGVLVGQCRAPEDVGVCVVAFSAASTSYMLEQMQQPQAVSVAFNEDQTEVVRAPMNLASDKLLANVHGGLWGIYERMRTQLDQTILEATQGCSKVHVTGTGAGAALASFWVMEHQQKFKHVNQVLFGASPAWYHPLPDMQCAGQHIFFDTDPTVSVRQAEYQAYPIRHPALPARPMTFVRSSMLPSFLLPVADAGSWVANSVFGTNAFTGGSWGVGPPKDCAADLPVDPVQQAGATEGMVASLKARVREFWAALPAYRDLARYQTAVDECFPQAPAVIFRQA